MALLLCTMLQSTVMQDWLRLWSAEVTKLMAETVYVLIIYSYHCIFSFVIVSVSYVIFDIFGFSVRGTTAAASWNL